MTAGLVCVFIFIRLFEAKAELSFQQLMMNQSLQLSCSPQQQRGSLSGLYLYHRSSRSQTTVLSITESEVRVDPGCRGRLQLYGRLNSHQVNVTISPLEPGDTGLYVWELNYKETYDQMILSPQRVFLLVEGTGRTCQCSSSYPPLLLTMFAAAGILLLTLSWMAIDKCVKVRRYHALQPSSPIYEEMTRKQQPAATPQNNEGPSHLEEVDFPVYANPNIRQPQDNYYACPRQLTLRA